MTIDNLTARTVCIVHCNELSGGRLERHIRSVISTIPDHVRVIATVTDKQHLTPRTRRRVEVRVVSDGGASLIEREVSSDAQVVVLPRSARVTGPWFEHVSSRLADDSAAIGVLPLAEQHLFAYPAGVTHLDGPRKTWERVEGVEGRVHDIGALSRPTVSAVLIVKDEQQRLPQCLAALAGVVDEVVVYDTGSSDSTAAVARDLGARVVEGHWDDDFSAARNRALAHATGDWVLSVDADEVLEADRGSLANWLDRPGGDAALVRVVSVSWSGGTAGDELRAVRLFRREGAQWIGALHEQVVAAPGARPRRPCSTMPPVRLKHYGYTLSHERAAEKAARNLTISERAYLSAADDDPRRGELAVDYARSLGLAGLHDEFLDVVRGLDPLSVTSGNIVQAARGAVPLFLQRRELVDAERWTALAAGAGEAPGLIGVWRSLAKAARGDVWTAVAELERQLEAGPAVAGRDLWGRAADTEVVVRTLVELELLAGRSQRAAERMVHTMLRTPETVDLALLFKAVLAAGGSLEDIARHVPALLVERSLREIPAQSPDIALQWCSALAEARPGDSQVMAAACLIAARTSVDAALEWSVRSREDGLGSVACALRWLAEDEGVHVRSAALAWALLVHGLGEVEHSDALSRALSHLSVDDAADVEATLRRVVPDAQLTPAVEVVRERA